MCRLNLDINDIHCALIKTIASLVFWVNNIEYFITTCSAQSGFQHGAYQIVKSNISYWG